MSTSVRIVDGPLPEAVPSPPLPGAGAVVSFEGIVRDREGERLIVALDYEAYEPMATRQLESLSREIVESHGLLELAVWHSRGRIPVGACSFRLIVRSRHRREALAGVDVFIDRLKRDVPIWKTALFAR
jgi:molybdopterin synthase catalytic subunit